MSKIGTGELLLILAVALLIFGPSKLPALGKMAGKAIGTLRHYADTDNWGDFMDEEESDAPGKKDKVQEEASQSVKETESVGDEPEQPEERAS